MSDLTQKSSMKTVKTIFNQVPNTPDDEGGVGTAILVALSKPKTKKLQCIKLFY